MGTSTTTGTTYMSVQNGGTEQATWVTPQTSLSIYWGSIDAMNVDGILNQVSITVDGYTLTGSDLMALGATGNGSQGSPADNEWVTITGLNPFTTVDFHDAGKNAFEFSLASGVPEPSTWAMMALGFAGIGFLGWRGAPKPAAQAAQARIQEGAAFGAPLLLALLGALAGPSPSAQFERRTPSRIP